MIRMGTYALATLILAFGVYLASQPDKAGNIGFLIVGALIGLLPSIIMVPVAGASKN